MMMGAVVGGFEMETGNLGGGEKGFNVCKETGMVDGAN